MYNVQKITRTNGRVDLYFRKAGMERQALTSPLPADADWEGSPLKAEVDAILGGAPAAAGAGTLGAALDYYETKSADFAVLEDSSKRNYRHYMKQLHAELGAAPVAGFTPKFIEGLRNRWAPQGYCAARDKLLILKHALRPSIIEANKGDPFALIKAVKRPRGLGEPHVVWPDAVTTTLIERAIAHRRFGLARGMALGRYAGMRLGDIVKVTDSIRVPQAGSNRGRINFRSSKKQVLVNMPEDSRLAEWLAATPARQPVEPRIARRHARAGVVKLPTNRLVYKRDGQAFTAKAFGQYVVKFVAEAFAEGVIDSDRYNTHGLRHTFGVQLALSGCSDAEGAAMMGHDSPTSFKTYRRQAARDLLANSASAKLDRLMETEAEQACNKAL
jgi:integrase